MVIAVGSSSNTTLFPGPNIVPTKTVRDAQSIRRRIMGKNSFPSSLLFLTRGAIDNFEAASQPTTHQRGVSDS